MPENDDGTAHFAYYNVELLLSFCWSGDLDRPVQVSYGGYGEPVVREYDADLFAPYTTEVKGTLDLLRAFKRFCDDIVSVERIIQDIRDANQED